MSQTVTDQPEQQAEADWEASRREKLRKIQSLGHDPWGQRFDNHTSIADIRARAGEVVYRTADGRDVTLVDAATAGEGFDFRIALA